MTNLIVKQTNNLENATNPKNIKLQETETLLVKQEKPKTQPEI